MLMRGYNSTLSIIDDNESICHRMSEIIQKMRKCDIS